MSIKEGQPCFFCGKSRSGVNIFVAGSSIYICNECIAQANKNREEEASAVQLVLAEVEVQDALNEVLDELSLRLDD
ncbi:hypothetical protein A2533_02725 [Candidatus Falkowbacteria bacterium RIFOXYD2_FULL_35_9]|uniref:ClpX-type ZB domain-containing protein n=1 Tax=Candidatus Falkowbacteria bacterium RIFOXYC2_FULL_36_12 TaxID=1798002 RepID=A0A1F5T4Z6_9BACT|nr:MAG: hypothetical protein A2300_03110 [Candidatus Falkowbacteria bacterium RIFOXYB2_FULL_35_7]OGF33511.1 MAG: hypothetical protein A2478_02385 [Candidatus Falkowbacteria bacterium RIFOXYC2_FULL_36_12]OGF47778.1 MAG: hypothetical protein A2533_02725 [Candidatus Falkowbacteria bacterium RIFOXYD2_FULL_35_9]